MALSQHSKRFRGMASGHDSSDEIDLSADSRDSVGAASPASASTTTSPWETFDASISIRELPIVVFTDDVAEQQVWHEGSIVAGRVKVPKGRPDVVAVQPVVMSPAYLGFAIEPYELRYLHYRQVGIIFARPRGGKFMQPSIDTILVCQALHTLFAERASSLGVSSILDVGSGSGFLGKFAAAHLPGGGPLTVTLLDIDPAAMQYGRSSYFNATQKNFAGRPVEWEYVDCEAVKFLEGRSDFDLIVANPPYIPTVEETRDSQRESLDGNFWEGCGLVAHLLERMFDAPPEKHLLLAFSSMTLKSLRVQELFAALPSRRLEAKILVEREIAWKAWYAGRGVWGGGSRHLLATGSGVSSRTRIGDCDFFVGATDSPRVKREGRHHFDYHWHMSYVVHISRSAPKSELDKPLPGSL